MELVWVIVTAQSLCQGPLPTLPGLCRGQVVYVLWLHDHGPSLASLALLRVFAIIWAFSFTLTWTIFVSYTLLPRVSRRTLYICGLFECLDLTINFRKSLLPLSRSLLYHGVQFNFDSPAAQFRVPGGYPQLCCPVPCSWCASPMYLGGCQLFSNL